MRRIAVDAMGGDRAPAAELDAAAAAVREGAELEVILVGDQPRLEEELARRGVPARAPLSIHHASQVITMDDAPAAAVRTKKDASMRVCFDLCKEGRADAVVSAGHSGAMLACGLFVLGRLPGVDRPAIVTTLPTVGGSVVLCDMGANVDPRPELLAQFGVLGGVHAQVALGRTRPRVGLLSNGAEESKGTSLTREAHALLKRIGADPGLGLAYLGYIEGRDIFGGAVDVVVTDGFTGNVAVKTAEGAGLAILAFLKEAFASSARARLGALLARPALQALKKKIDYAENGGAPLVGVDGVVMICHGAATAPALETAIFQASRMVGHRAAFRERLAAAVARTQDIWQSNGGPDRAASGGVE